MGVIEDSIKQEVSLANLKYLIYQNLVPRFWVKILIMHTKTSLHILRKHPVSS
jgi:hypothetical protein